MGEAGHLRRAEETPGELCLQRLSSHLSPLTTFYLSDLPQVLIISQNIGGQLQIHTDWPSPLRNKGVFFVKREAVPLPDKVKELLNHMTCGDIHPNSLEHFCALVEEVMVPILKNEANMSKFPLCISEGNYIELKHSKHLLLKVILVKIPVGFYSHLSSIYKWQI